MTLTRRTHLPGEPRTYTLCGLVIVDRDKTSLEPTGKLPTTNDPSQATCGNCTNLYYGEPKARVWHAEPPIKGVPF